MTSNNKIPSEQSYTITIVLTKKIANLIITISTIIKNHKNLKEKNSEYKNENKYNDYKSETSYNQRDRERELQLLEENKKSKRKQFWLGLGMVVLLVIIVIFAVSTFMNGGNDDQQTAN